VEGKASFFFIHVTFRRFGGHDSNNLLPKTVSIRVPKVPNSMGEYKLSATVFFSVCATSNNNTQM
jgi:hypothetical protein